MSCQHIFMFVLRQLGARSAGHLCSQDFDSTFTVPSFTPLASASFYILHHVSHCNYCTHDAFQICLVRLRWWATVDADVLVSTTCQAKLARLSRSIVAETRDLYDLCSSFVDSHLCNFQRNHEKPLVEMCEEYQCGNFVNWFILFVCIRLKASNLCAGSLKFDIDQDNDSWQHILCCENLGTEVDMVKLLN